jgi:hypothetical protein
MIRKALFSNLAFREHREGEKKNVSGTYLVN